MMSIGSQRGVMLELENHGLSVNQTHSHANESINTAPQQ